MVSVCSAAQRDSSRAIVRFSRGCVWSWHILANGVQKHPKAHFSLHQPGEALFDHGAIHTLCLHSGSGFGEPILINTDCSTNGYDCHPGWLHVRCHHVVDSGLPCLYAHRPDSQQRSPTAPGEVTQWGAKSFKGAKWAYIVSRCRAVANVHLTFNMWCPLKFESGSVIHSEILPMRYPLSCTTQTKLLFGWTPAALWFVAYQLINHEVSMYCSLSERSLGWELNYRIGCWRLFVGSVWVQTTYWIGGSMECSNHLLILGLVAANSVVLSLVKKEGFWILHSQ